MNIGEVEKVTGITKQNIRFYEKEGLICPERNKENDYREYGEGDIRQLKLIYIMRKMGISIPDIKKVFSGELTLAAAAALCEERMLQEREEKEVLLEFCKDIKTQSLEWIDEDKYKERIDNEEKQGNAFRPLWDEYKEVYLSEQKKKFTIYPDIIVMTPSDFTLALLKYAEDRKADITILKEGMYPEFIYNGVEYSAYRVVSRFGSRIICEMKNPMLVEPTGIDKNRKIILRGVAKYLPQMLLLLLIIFLFVGRSSISAPVGLALMSILTIISIILM